MKRHIIIRAAIGGLLMAALLTGCSPSADTHPTGQAAAEVTVRAMAEAIGSAGTDPAVSIAGNSYTINSFKADDGSRITGTIQTGEDGTITAARLRLIYPDGTSGPEFVLTADNGSTDVTVDDQSINASRLPQAMTRSQRIAFLAFLSGFDEAFDELNEIIEESVEYLEDRRPGEYSVDRGWLKGTVTVGREEPGDDDTEIIAADIAEFNIEMWNGAGISGSYSFTERNNNGKADIRVTMRGFSESDDGFRVTLEEITVDASIEEGERFDDDYFSFDGSIGGKYIVNGEKHTISFSGEIDAMEDRYFRFPSYSLTIDGEDVLIGRQSRY